MTQFTVFTPSVFIQRNIFMLKKARWSNGLKSATRPAISQTQVFQPQYRPHTRSKGAVLGDTVGALITPVWSDSNLPAPAAPFITEAAGCHHLRATSRSASVSCLPVYRARSAFAQLRPQSLPPAPPPAPGSAPLPPALAPAPALADPREFSWLRPPTQTPAPLPP